jgi:hypothetical protein
MVYIINPSHQSVWLYVYPFINVARQRLGKKKRYGGNEYTRNNRKIIGLVIFYAVRVVSKERSD